MSNRVVINAVGVVVLIYLLQNRPIGQIKPHEFEETSADIFKTRKGSV